MIILLIHAMGVAFAALLGWAVNSWPPYSPGIMEFKDYVNLGLTVVGAVLATIAVVMAFRQEKLGRSQEAIALRQEAMAKRQGEIAEELHGITKRQVEISERQHAIFEAQMAKKTDLRVITGRQDLNWSKDYTEFSHVVVTVKVHNGGDKSSEGFYWELLLTRATARFVTFTDLDDNALETGVSNMSNSEHYIRLDGFHGRLFPYTGVEVAKMVVNIKSSGAQEFILRWRIRADEGLIPGKGLAEIGLRRPVDDTYHVLQLPPGERVEDIDDPPTA